MGIQILIIVVLAGALSLTWRRERQGAISRLSAVLWSLLWLGAGIVVLRPEVSSAFAAMVGVGRGVDAVLYLAVLLLFTMSFRTALRVERVERDITKLVREISLDRATSADRARE